MPDQPSVGVKLGRGVDAVFPFFVMALIAIPLIALRQGVEPLDALRYFTLVQAAIVVALYGYAVVFSVLSLYREWKTGTQSFVGLPLRLGRICRLLGVIFLTTLGAIFVASRIGEDELIGMTPLFQLAMVCLVVAWIFSERFSIIVERRSTAAQLERLTDALNDATGRTA